MLEASSSQMRTSDLGGYDGRWVATAIVFAIDASVWPDEIRGERISGCQVAEKWAGKKKLMRGTVGRRD
jgi:hypothetical protein